MKNYTILLLLCFTFHLSSIAQLPKGDRILAWQVDVTENDDYGLAFGFAADACQESTHLSLTWSGLEPDAGEFDPDFIASRLDAANFYFPYYETKVEMQIAVTNTTTKELPADLMATDFNDPVLIERFKTALDTIFAHIPDIDLAALNIGNESDILFGTDESMYTAYKAFLDSIVPYAKSAYFDLYEKELTVGTTLTLDGLTNPLKSSFCQTLNEDLDVISTTYYPLAPDFTMESPDVVEGHFDALVELYPSTDQPIYFAECGYASSETCNSSEALQAEFFSSVFAAWDKHYDNIKYLTIFKSTDWSLAEVEYFGTYYGIDDPIFLEYLRTLGVRTWDGDGNNKLAYEFILCELEARDWCDVDCGLTQIENKTLKSDIQVYPNPASDILNIHVNDPVELVTIYNSMGQSILQTNEISIDLNALNPGIYFAHLQLSNQTEKTLKFTKQ